MRSAYGAKEHGISEHPVTIIVDTANVMGARPDGWWRDRAGAAVRLHAEIERLAASGRPILPQDTGPPERTGPPQGTGPPERTGPPQGTGPPERTGPPQGTGPPEFIMVLEGAAKAASSRISDAASPGRVRVVQAYGSGDDAIVALVRELPGRRVVVTADRELRDRTKAAGATVLGPGWLLGLLRR